MKEAKLNSYFLEKCIIGNGIINGILNAIIFYFMEKKHPDAIFATGEKLFTPIAFLCGTHQI